MQFQELTDKQWDIVKRHVPKPARTGRPGSDDRATIDGILFVLTTGRRCDDMPKRYGDDSTQSPIKKMAGIRGLEKDSQMRNKISPQAEQNQPAKDIS